MRVWVRVCVCVPLGVFSDNRKYAETSIDTHPNSLRRDGRCQLSLVHEDQREGPSSWKGPIGGGGGGDREYPTLSAALPTRATRAPPCRRRQQHNTPCAAPSGYRCKVNGKAMPHLNILAHVMESLLYTPQGNNGGIQETNITMIVSYH